MESKPVNVNDDAEARQRFHSFKLSKGFPSTFSSHKPPHSRSHSRNISVSSTSSFSIPLSRPIAISSDDSHPSDTGSSPGQGLTPSTRRNSHHRRRSSVSTRRESAEMMGIALPDLPPLTEDASNSGEKDSIRRRALWALEGKDVYSKVEIPELSTPQMEKIMSEFPSMPSFSPSSGMISNKRDSFKLLSSASSTKDHLHTLVEEEEEEEEGPISNHMGPKAAEHLATLQPAHGSSLTVKPAMNRPKPASLNLRPLSLTPETISISVAQPQPAFSRSTVHSGLKSLSLSSSVTCEQSSSLPSRGPRSQSFNSPSRSSTNETPFAEDSNPRRRSSIPYKTSSDVVTNFAGLPTPEKTPNYQEQHFSWSELLKNSSEDVFFPPSPTKKRPLSASEQCFLVKSYGTLLARIAELERALSAKISPSYSQRTASISSDISFSSDQTGTTLGESSDEMLQLIADLKSERDEYKKDIDAWRVRVHDMDNKIAMMAKRVEVERHEAWLARSRVSLLEAEKASLEKKLECSEASLTMVQEEKSALELKNQELQDEMEQVHADLIQVRQLLGQAQQEIKDMKRPKIVAADLTDEDDGSCQYEEESDISFRTSSSVSIDEPPSSGVLFALNYLASDVQTAVEAVQGHASKDSLSKSWTFPTGAQAVIESCKAEAEVDDFFGCLEVVEDEGNALLYTDPSEYSYERSKGLFSEALKSFCDDQDAPFFPEIVCINEDGAQTVAGSGKLSAAMEEEVSDNDEGMLGEANGICITLTPAQDDDDVCEEDVFVTSPSSPPVLPPLNFDHNVEELRNALSFNFSYYDISETLAADSRSPSTKVTSANSSSIHQFAFPNSPLGPSISPAVVPRHNQGTNASPQFATSTRAFQSTQRWSTDICTHTNLPSFANGLTSIPPPCIPCRRS